MSEKKTEEKIMSVEEYMNQPVSFQAIYDGEKYKDDITMTINGKTWRIKRGVTVMMPRFVYKAITDADRQKMKASAVSQMYEKKFEQLAGQNIL